MSGPLKRWVEDGQGASDESLALLRRARKGPDAAAKSRIWRDLSAGSAAAASGAAGARATAHSVTQATLVKLTIALVAAIGLYALARAIPSAPAPIPQSSSPPSPRAPTPIRVATATAPAQPVPESAPLIPAPVAHTIVAPASSASIAVARVTRQATPNAAVSHLLATHAPASAQSIEAPPTFSNAASTAVVQDELEAEIALVATARASLASDPARALQLVETPAPSQGPSALAHERDAIAIDALLRLNRFHDAVARADRFLAAHPSSTSAPRIRALRREALAADARP